jgi:deazaflavin-dependent oxidoreductase (nitroreductase family)
MNPAYSPSRSRRLANRVLSWLLRRGNGPAFISLLTVEGRVTGLPRTTPVVPVRDGDKVWVVSPYGEVAWVKNARATRRVELHRGEDRVAYDAVEVDPHTAVAVLRIYLSMPSERFARGDFDVTAHSTGEAIAEEAPRHPVFELTPLS